MPHTVCLVGRLPPAMDEAMRSLTVETSKAIDMNAAIALGPALGVVTSSEVVITDTHMSLLPGLAFIGRAAAGTDNIDDVAAKRRKIAVLSIPKATAPCAAELTMAHIVAIVRRVPTVAKKLRDGIWAKDVLGEEVAGKLLGIVGLGRVGGRVARLARAFGMKVVACDPYIPKTRFKAHGARPVTLPALLDQADVVTLHVPLTAETRGLIGQAELARLKPGRWLVNCARGGIVDEEALLGALDRGQLAGAAIDTWVGEPNVNAALLHHPLVLGTPHVGAATVQAKARLVSMMVDEVRGFMVRRRLA